MARVPGKFSWFAWPAWRDGSAGACVPAARLCSRRSPAFADPQDLLTRFARRRLSLPRVEHDIVNLGAAGRFELGRRARRYLHIIPRMQSYALAAGDAAAAHLAGRAVPGIG